MQSTACEICSGRHLTSACVIGSDFIAQCLGTTRDPSPIRVVGLEPVNVFDLDEYRRSVERAKKQRWREKTS